MSQARLGESLASRERSRDAVNARKTATERAVRAGGRRRYGRRVACDDPCWREILPAEPIRFGSDFAWGVASSAFQAEGGAVANDWVEAAREGRVPENPGNGFWERAESDFETIAGLGLGHYRLSVEWSRVEPERGRFDAAALDRYARICEAARVAGLTPWVNFFHFTHPRWFASSGGFLRRENHGDFLRYVERTARALAPYVRHFHVQNESMVYVLVSYLLGQNPPFVRSRDAAFDMTETVLRMTADGARRIRHVRPDAIVSGIEVHLDARPLDPDDPAQCEGATRFDSWYHGTLLEALASGWVRLPGRDPVEIPHLRNAFDFYGFNYYSSTAFGPAGPVSYAASADAPLDAMRRHVFPEGLCDGLLRVARALPDMPLLVTENGCPTRDERFRIRYIAAHLAALDRARRLGADVRGYFHWTAVDNYEWHHGFSDARFGLVGFDPRSGERHVKQSGHWLAAVIASGKVDPAAIP
ncbi:beta-glucosidase [Myxococcaceae bacterium]|nr:beta-glucosidase [Myxococcaceae bacterium]